MMLDKTYYCKDRANIGSMEMKNCPLCIVSSVIFVLLFVPLRAAEEDSPGIVSPSASKPPTVNSLYPGLTSGALAYARACELAKGTLLRAGTLVIRAEELAEEIAKAPPQMQPELKKNALFRLEQIATFRLLLAEAKAQTEQSDKDVAEKTDPQIIEDHLQTLVKGVDVNDTEIRRFYDSNTQMLGGATLAQIGPQIKQFLLQQKQQEFVNERIRTIGRRMSIEISAPWLKKHAILARDNPVDKARSSGRPSLVDFGSVGCIPCDMMAPILDKLRKKYEGKVNVLFVHVKEKPILAGRYGVQTIPLQIFFDKSGKEVFRHTGFFSEEEIEKQLLKMGAK